MIKLTLKSVLFNLVFVMTEFVVIEVTVFPVVIDFEVLELISNYELKKPPLTQVLTTPW
jgi:hypothetical protein